MKLMKTVRGLFVAVAFLGVTYAPQAMASNDITETVGTGALTAPYTTNQIIDTTISPGSFTDTFNFTAGSNATASVSVSSLFENVVNTATNAIISSPYHGVEITKLELVNVSNNTDVIVTKQNLTETSTSRVGADSVNNYNDTISISGYNIIKNDVYQLQVVGLGGAYIGVGTGNYSGTLTLTSAVPEPEAWAMLLLGMPMVSWMVRRRQALA